MRRWVLALAVLVGLGLVGCTSATRDEQGAVTEAGTEEVLALQVGDCIASLGGTMADGDGVTDGVVDVVPCQEPHLYEVYSERRLSLPEFSDDIPQMAEDFCSEQYSAFIGVDYEQSKYVFTSLYPTEEGWALAGDRTISCIVHEDDLSAITGSLKGVGA